MRHHPRPGHPRSLAIIVALAGCGAPPAAPATPAAPDHGAREHAMHDHAKHDHAKHDDPATAGDHAGPHADHRGGMHHRFEDADAWAKVFDDPARDAWQQPDQVIAALALTPAMTVADIGAGTGYFSVRLARAVPQGRVIATDVEPDMARYLTARAAREQLTNVTAVTTPPDDPQLTAGAVDRILVVDVWHHLGDRPAYARRLAAGLKPGGWIAIVDFKLDATRGPPREHRLAAEAIVADLRAAGLVAEVAKLALPDQYLVIGRR